MNLANTPVRLDSNGYLIVSIGAGSTALFASGTAAAPSISFSANSNRGFFNDTVNNAIGIAVAGTQSGFLDGTGFRLGVTTTSGGGIVLSSTNVQILDNAGGARFFIASGGPVVVNSAALQIASAGTAKYSFQLIGTTDGQIFIGNGAGSAGVGFDVATDGTLKLRNKTATAGTGNLDIGAKITAYNGVATTGQGVASIYGAQRVTGTTAAATFLSGYTSGAADETLQVSAYILVTTHGSEAITVACSYTDPSGSARVFTMPLMSVAGAVAPTVGAAGMFSSPGQYIRVKQTTAVSIATTGTFTGATYTADGTLMKIS